MAKRKVIWSKNALDDLLEIIEYYNSRNKSNTYSQKLSKEIKFKLQTIDFTVALPQKTSVKICFILLIIISRYVLKF